MYAYDYYAKRIPQEPNEIKKALTWFTQHYGSPDCIKYDANNEPDLSSIPDYVKYFYAVRGAYPDKALTAAANDFINHVYNDDRKNFISFSEINLIICLHASIDSTNAIVELAKAYNHIIDSHYDYPNKLLNMMCNGFDTIMSENANANDKGAYASKAISSITDTLNCFNALIESGVINCAQFMNVIDNNKCLPFHGYETVIMSACEHYKHCDCSVSDDRLVNIITHLTAGIRKSLPYNSWLNAHAFLSYVINHSSMYSEPLRYHIMLEAFRIISLLYDNGLIPKQNFYGAYDLNLSPLLYATKVIMKGYPAEYSVQAGLLKYDTDWIINELDY